MLSPLPRHSNWDTALLIHPVVSAFPDSAVGSACATSFSRLAQRSLTLRPAHSRCHRILRHASPKASTISLPPQLLRLLPAGAVAGWGFHPLENAAFSRRTHLADLRRYKKDEKADVYKKTTKNSSLIFLKLVRNRCSRLILRILLAFI